MSKAVTNVEGEPAVAGGMRVDDELSLEQLATVHGGMRWQHFRPSQNVEDRRGSSQRSPRPRALPIPELGPRYDGDLPSQAGLDDVIRMQRRRRRR